MDAHDSVHDLPHAVSQAFNLTSTTMQNQIHELAKTLPPPRKQNTACDACRARKVKCQPVLGQEKCQHCLSKNYPCTHFVQQATTEKKRNAARRPRTLSTSQNNATPGSSRVSPAADQSLPSSPNYSTPTSFRALQGGSPISSSTSIRDLLAYLFSPPTSSAGHGYSSPGIANAYAEWGELAPSLAEDSYRTELRQLIIREVFFQIVHSRIPLLNPAQFRARLRLSLHMSSRSRSHSSHSPPSTSPGSPFGSRSHHGHNDTLRPLHPALVATVIAWGAKFSEHPVFMRDRMRNNNHSRLAKMLVNRARDLAEDLKVHRIPSAEHVVIALLIETMQSQSKGNSLGYHGFWIGSAIRMLLELQINRKSVMVNIQDPEERGTMVFAWWMACIAEAYGSAYYRRKPMLDDDDYDIDFYTAGPVPPENMEAQEETPPSPREQLEFLVSSSTLSIPQYPQQSTVRMIQGYYRAAHALARIARNMSRQLWRPATESDGIPVDVFKHFIEALTGWREQYLSMIGVPTNALPSNWDFVSAVTSCASDATYHIMWIILFNAADDFGIKEIRDVQEAMRAGSPGQYLPNTDVIEEYKQKVMDMALQSASRIAGLAGILAQNGYLKLDSAVMHVSIIQAGMLLARLGRPEVQNCIDGLQQYSYAYEECAEQANEMQRLYHQAVNRDTELNYMASVDPRTPSGMGVDHVHAMNVDQPLFGAGYHS
ncbi:uncharacterized protein LAESUDRAFT_756976 [Laetiporus sulphureus 93-53]|uniref:Zn(2)-C6 fungal-type domain-containing protein n=1 Tax=Laetiporus sulphureus 93-53 TaxID=1314785 RepID=A0A165FSD5_9APHY|nr:uncharacterized protein LAESUDRAFT_756976 [Laetiporus sulphureus 93-53]KZT09351.1 hypothetical protein LAESUDRAFT_756976 [Laetiporus sulphureus 93-53]